MTSLPKRGDRVRVTDTLYQPWLVGKEMTLTRDAHWYDDTQTWLRFRCDEAGYVGAVKVEILERAGAKDEDDGCVNCDKPMVKAEVITEDGAHFCSERCYAEYFGKEVNPEFARGMRRAVEIAEGLSSAPIYEGILARLREAVEKELADD